MSKKSIFIAFLIFLIITSNLMIPGYSHAETIVTVFPKETDIVLNNPYMGWAPSAKSKYNQPHRLVYANIYWRELEPQKGVYDFNTIESKNQFAYWQSKDVKIVLRLVLDEPRSTSHMDIPDWLYKEINQEGTWYDISYGKGFSPNYLNPVLIANHRILISKLAEKYNNDPRIAMIAIGSVGHWGEFHTYDTIPFPKLDIINQYVQHYVDFFDKKMLLMRRPHEIALKNNMGLFNDVFGIASSTKSFVDRFLKGYTFWLTGEKMPGMPDFWKYASSGGEFGNSPGLQYLEDDAIADSLQMLRDSHTSWLGPCCPANQPVGCSIQANMDAMLKTMSYRFVLSSASFSSSIEAGKTLTVTMDWKNKGVAPFYFDWPLELSLIDSRGNLVLSKKLDEDIRKWVPGQKAVTGNMDIPETLAPGTYTLCVAILDPDKNAPGIDFAFEGRTSTGRYSIGNIIVSQSGTHSPSVTSTPSSTHTATSTPTRTPTSTITNTPTNTRTSTSTRISTPTRTSIPTRTPTPTRIFTPTSTRIPISTYTNAPTSTPSKSNPVFKIDGNSNDWNSFNPISYGSGSANYLYAVENAGKLYILVKGSSMNTTSDFFIDSDNNSATGYKGSVWPNSGIDYLIEGSTLYKYSGSGRDWTWTKIGSITISKSNTSVEACLNISQIGLTKLSPIKLSYIKNYYYDPIPAEGAPMPNVIIIP